MIPQHVLVGGLTAILCLMLLMRQTWFLEHSKKGRRLVQWFGPQKARWVLLGLTWFGVILGILIATQVLRPIQW
ncbi:hypothetical protein [Schlesneria paludicola]|uniref:hypothetical protein n=1 Tax=Schlesneria paludicola TaxID=360056 RepID=UPI0002DF7C76|nr:hypothetical protein [Schlesneria paludicola]